MEFPQSFSGFLEGDFKDTRVWGQGSCCLTFAMRYSSKKFLIAKKDSFLQYILWRANPISSKHASAGELWVILTPWWCVGGKEEVGSNSSANRPYISTHICSACTFGCWDRGINRPVHRSSALCGLFTGPWGAGSRGHWRERWMCGRGDEENSE